ncbi:MAG: protein kinase [Deltaproteobacteria bacterium]|nr:protein kinase [Deltaproteobacteria bacterium]
MARLVIPERGTTGTAGTEPADVRHAPLGRLLAAGTLFADRFRVRGALGSGSSGHVVVAEDTATGHDVALKIFAGTGLAERFSREGALLATLSHPAIVAYIDHGVSAAGERYVATALLRGQTLKQRLRQGPLSQADAARVGMRVASALAMAHANGIIHRDIKPENLMVVDDDLNQVTVLDFGIARHVDFLRVTGTGHWVGTPMYMAPEQARGEADLDGRADLFSLGCVLLECLLAKPLFVGDSALATLAKICFSDHVPLAQLCPDVDPGLQDVLAGLLLKDRERRTPNAKLVVQNLERVLPTLLARPEAPPRQQPSSIGSGERRVHALLLISPASSEVDQHPVTTQVSETLSRVAPWTKSAQTLLGGTVLVTVPGDSPMDQAVNAGRCALALRTVSGDRRFALGLGRKFSDVGNQDLADVTTALLSSTQEGEIRVDETVAALLQARFEVASKLTEEGEVFTLQAERHSLEPPRTVLGKVLPCVGRQRELANLQAIFAECVIEPGARAILVTAPAGGGKSRVRFELMQALQAQRPSLHFLIARGDPLRSNAPLGVVAALLRSKAQIHGSEDRTTQQALVLKHIGRHIHESESDPQHKRRTIAFLGELMGVPFSDDGLLSLQTARKDPHVMGDQTKLAWLEFVKHVSADEPLVLVLEDLHWGDSPSVQAIDDAMRVYRDRPIFVAAFARPEIEMRFPRLWRARSLEHVNLRPLPASALTQLVSEVLPEAAPELVARLTRHCDGNPFFLEELLRAQDVRSALEREDAAPSSVLGVIQARFDALGEEAKRVLRAASVFGERFAFAGLNALLKPDASTSIERSLDLLSDKEIIYMREHNDQNEFAFRHALLRDAAYDMITQADRKAAHLAAGLWLEADSFPPVPSELVEHFEQGGSGDKAALWCCAAAKDAMAGADVNQAIAFGQRGLANGAQGELHGSLRMLQAEALTWRGDFEQAENYFHEAFNRLPPNAARTGYLHFMVCLINLSKHRDAVTFATRLSAELDSLAALDTQKALAAAVTACIFLGDEPAMAFLLQFRTETLDECTLGHWLVSDGTRILSGGDPLKAITAFTQAVAAFRSAGDLKYELNADFYASVALADLGDYRGAQDGLNQIRQKTLSLNLLSLQLGVDANLLAIYLRTGDPGRTLREGHSVLSKLRECNGDNIWYCMAVMAQAYLNLGDVPSAQLASAESVEASKNHTAFVPLAASVRAKVLLASRQITSAIAMSRVAMEAVFAKKPLMDGEMLARSTYVDCLLAVGRHEDAVATARGNAQRLAHLTTRITAPKYQLTYLHNIPENRDVVRQARELGIDLNTPDLRVLLL